MGRSNPAARLLLFAEPLQREGMRQWLGEAPERWRLLSESEAETDSPQLVIWSLATAPDRAGLVHELQRLQERWQPAPLLLLLPAAPPYPLPFLLELPAQGLLEAPDAEALRAAVRTLLGGGRVVEIAATATPSQPQASSPALGLGQWLLISGLQQIDAEREFCHRLLEPPPGALAELLLRGRLRELAAARRLLLWLWGPLQLAWGQPLLELDPPDGHAPPDGQTASAILAPPRPGLALNLRQRTADGIWEAVEQRLREGAGSGASNQSGQLLALDGLLPARRTDLLLALLEQVQLLRGRLQQSDPRGERLLASWQELQPELRRAALRRMAGTYVQLPQEGRLRPVADTLVSGSQLESDDPELPEATPMLATLLQARPLLVEGRLLPPDEPQAVLYLEMLLANWLVRSAEQIAAEVLAACAEWPELRRYLLRPELLATRNLERLRNQLNAQQRWNSLVRRPVALYESRRELFRLEAGVIRLADLTEPRDRELRQLALPQQLVTLGLEARDALAPQLQSLVKRLGDLLVVVLTQVIGRAIGLVGRGIAQGMGRSLHRG
ncbi:MAG: DUF3685 domain-containing protein [Synechococcaceae cyanobacterium]|nr:DUF3685 domain-containing protein [Synechococcaceae cyanobacterium]